MKNLSYESLKNEYISLWNTMEINIQKYPIVAFVSAKLSKYEYLYEKYGKMIPKFLLSFFNYLKSDSDFYNTIELNKKIPSLFTDNIDEFINSLKPFPETWTISYSLWLTEKLENFQYRNHKINSPTLWSFSNNYKSGFINTNNHFTDLIIYNKVGLAPLIKYNIDHEKIFMKLI